MEGNYVNIELRNKKREAAEKIALQKQIQASQQSIEELTGLSGVTGEALDCDDDDDECLALSEGSDFIRENKSKSRAKSTATAMGDGN